MAPNSSVDDILVPPTEDQLKVIRSEINEDADRLKHVEKLFHTWMDCQPHFPKNYDRKVIRNFLRNCKHNMDRAKTKVENYFTARNLYPDLFTNRFTYEKDVKKALQVVNMAPLPKLSKKGNRIFIFKLEDIDPNNFHIYSSSKLFLMIYDLLLTSEHPAAGDIAIFDGAGFSPQHLVKFLTLIKMISTVLREAYAIRLKEIHIVNAPPLVEKLLNVIKPLLHHKVRNSFIFHDGSTSLCTYFGEEIMPSNYGGKSKSLSELMDDWQEVLTNNTDWFFEQETVKITRTVSKRIENNLYFKESSLEGSFRNLQVD